MCLPLPWQISRAAPRNLGVPTSMQTLAACAWLLNNCKQEEDGHQLPPKLQSLQSSSSSGGESSSGGSSSSSRGGAVQQQFSSWRFREPEVLSRKGLVGSVGKVRWGERDVGAERCVRDEVLTPMGSRGFGWVPTSLLGLHA
jgi:hypothetical protein